MLLVQIFATAIFVGAVVCMIWKGTVWYRWRSDNNELSPWFLFGGAFFFGLLITLVWWSEDRDIRGLYNLVEGWNIGRWVLAIGIVVASLAYAVGIRLYAGEKDETLVE